MLSAQTMAATNPPLNTKLSPITQAVAEAIAATMICLTQVRRLVNKAINQVKKRFMAET
jgi:hypothetical protein